MLLGSVIIAQYNKNLVITLRPKLVFYKKLYMYLSLLQGSLSACEFLLLNGAKLDRKDRQGRTPLHIATMLGNTG